MAIAYVNSATGSADASSSTIATTAANHTTGNLLVAFVVWNHASNTLSSVSDTAGNTWTRITGTDALHGTADRCEMFYAKNITGNASNTVTATFSGGAAFRRIAVVQYSGVDTTAPLDQATKQTVTDTSITSPSFTTTSADEVIIAGMGSDMGRNVSPGTNYTLRVDSLAVDTDVEERIVTATGSYTASFSWSGGSQGAWLSVATFKAAGGGAIKTISGTTNLAFTESLSALVRTRVLAPTDNITFSESGSLVRTRALSPTDNITFTESASVTTGSVQAIAGSVAMSFAESATLVATRVLSATANISFTETASLVATKVLSGTANIAFSITASLTKTTAGASYRMVTGIAPAIWRMLKRNASL